MNWRRWEIRIEPNWTRSGFTVHIRRGGMREDGVPDEILSVVPLVLPESTGREREEDDKFRESYNPLVLEDSAAQQLMDELYKVGVRPTEGMGSAGSMAATLEHVKTLKEEARERRGTENRLLAMVEKAWTWGRE